jgi:hypothetical protein
MRYAGAHSCNAESGDGRVERRRYQQRGIRKEVGTIGSDGGYVDARNIASRRRKLADPGKTPVIAVEAGVRGIDWGLTVG